MTVPSFLCKRLPCRRMHPSPGTRRAPTTTKVCNRTSSRSWTVKKRISGHFALMRFLFCHVVLPGCDMVTDFLTFLSLSEPHPKWSLLTLGWMFMPLAIQLNIFISGKLRAFLCRSCYGKDVKQDKLSKVMLHLPFLRPIYNTWQAYRLHQLGYGTPHSNHQRVEAILREVAVAGQYEQYYESGPQAVSQLIFGLSTGEMSSTQVISVCVSIFSNTFGSSKAYFIQRQKDAADPDPNMKMVMLRVFCPMFIIVTTNLLLWVCIGGMIGPWTSLAVVFNFFVNLAAVMVFARKKDDNQEGAYAMKASMVENDNSTEIPKYEEKMSFPLKAAAFSIWNACVVGNHPRMFLTSALASLLSKMVILSVAVTLAALGFQDDINPNHFLLWCREEDTAINTTENTTLTLCTFLESNYTACYMNNSQAQKLRVCEESEPYLRIIFLQAIITFLLASLAATNCLNKTVDFAEMYRVSKSFLWCIKTHPEIHRSLLFHLIARDNADFLEEILVTDPKEARRLGYGSQDIDSRIGTIVNRPNREGATPLHLAAWLGSTRSLRILLAANANVDVPNNNQDTPLQLAFRNGHAEAAGVLMRAGATVTTLSEPPLGGISHVFQMENRQLAGSLLAWHAAR